MKHDRPKRKNHTSWLVQGDLVRLKTSATLGTITAAEYRRDSMGRPFEVDSVTILFRDNFACQIYGKDLNHVILVREAMTISQKSERAENAE